ncbi:MAG TPA: nucleotidyltransferase family protein [Longimicrobium sp.]|nr:nucleotidyltransferase family protein [Longimicrobium sp.]
MTNAFLEDRIIVTRAEIDEFCRRNHVRRLSLFGSVLREDFRPESDIDLLVEFDPEHVPGYFTLSAMERELSGLLGRKVDLRTPGEISDYYRDRVLASSEVWYESP